LSRLRDEYIETGKVRFIFSHYATLGPESTKAAEGSECAADQDAFWPYHDLLFADQVKNHSRVTDEYLMALAGQVGLDTAHFSDCLDNGGHDNRVIELAMRIKARGARGVPGFLINGQYIAGALPYEDFQGYLDAALAEAALD